ncbi:MAG: nickel pincer cofactor biosynthesis protein LarB [Actinomycetota bacterium]
MDPESIRDLLARVAEGDLSPDEGLEALGHMTFVDLGDAKPDVHRQRRTGQPEAVYGTGKSPRQVQDIVRTLAQADARPIVVTRATPEQYRAAREVIPEAVYHPLPRLAVMRPVEDEPLGTVAVVAAGTSDLPVAEEASVVAEALALKVERITDVGVAGVHRLVAYREALAAADCLIVVAGMEGALPSLVGGLVPTPVVAVPTSVGYGASFGGLAALLGMLTTCAPGVVVVNVDNGFGAAMAAHRIVRRRA